MSVLLPPDRDFSSPSLLRRQENACDRFERAWQEAEVSGTPPEIEAYLGSTLEPEYTALLRALLDLDLEYRARRGETPGEDDYLARFPDHAAVVEAALLTLPTAQDGVKTVNRRGGKSAPEPEMPFAIGKYRVVEMLGGGSQGEVYRAVHPELPGRDVVIKWAHPNLQESLYKQAIDEARIVAKLEDAGLVKVHDVDRHEGRPFVVLEHIAGARSLAEVLRHERLSIPRAVALTAELAATLARVHQKGVLHRDIKPANVLLDAGDRPRLIDFGLAHLAQAWEAINAPGDGVCGTFAYMAPEQARGEADRIGPRADVFSLGAVLYELLTNRPPYPGGNWQTTWEQAKQAQVTPPRQINPRIPPALERICLKALATDPERRFASAAEMERALYAHLRQPRRFTATRVLSGVALAILLVGAGYFWLAPARAPLSGELIVRVWSPDGVGAQGRRVDQPGVLPLTSKASLRLEARLNQPAHVYLVSVDSAAKVTILFPRSPQAVIQAPADRRAAWPLGSKGGMHTILLLARRTTLPADVSLEQLLGEILSTPFRSAQDIVVDGFDQDLSVSPVGEDEELGRGQAEARINDPFWEMICRLRSHFETIRYVRFAHQGDCAWGSRPQAPAGSSKGAFGY